MTKEQRRKYSDLTLKQRQRLNQHAIDSMLAPFKRGLKSIQEMIQRKKYPKKTPKRKVPTRKRTPKKTILA